jgi:hypothetical protein
LELCERGRVAFFTVVPELRVVLVATGNSTLIHSLAFSAVSITVSSWHRAVKLARQKKNNIIDLIIN